MRSFTDTRCNCLLIIKTISNSNDKSQIRSTSSKSPYLSVHPSIHPSIHIFDIFLPIRVEAVRLLSARLSVAFFLVVRWFGECIMLVGCRNARIYLGKAFQSLQLVSTRSSKIDSRKIVGQEIGSNPQISKFVCIYLFHLF